MHFLNHISIFSKQVQAPVPVDMCADAIRKYTAILFFLKNKDLEPFAPYHY